MNTSLPKVRRKKPKRLGRGYGSGKGGHTSGRGQKGQKSRGKIGILFEGMKVKKSLLKRLPLQRGKGRFKASKKPIIVKLAYLNLLSEGSTVDLNLLVKEGIARREDAQKYGLKILGNGEIGKKLNIAIPISKSAGKRVEKAGGKILSINPEVKESKPKKKK